MVKKKRSRYGDYCEMVDGKLFAVVNLRQPSGKYKKKRKLVSNKTEARQWALNELDKLKKGHSLSSDITFQEFANWYKEEFLKAPRYEKGIKVEGSKDYLRATNKISKMSNFFGSKRISQFNELDVRQWQSFRRDEENVSTVTLNRDFALMKTMFKRGVKYKVIEHMPEFPINRAAEVERDRILTFQEEKSLLDVCKEFETIEVKRGGKIYKTKIETKREHLKTLIIVAVDTGMRMNEILTLTWKDVDLDANIITVQFYNAKTQKTRKIGMTSRVKYELTKLQGRSNKTAKIWNLKNIHRSFNTACKRADITGLNFHDLRHTATTRMIRAGIPHTEVMKTTGHSQIKTFLRYLNLIDSAIQDNSNRLSAFVENNQNRL
jgi:integrase